MKPGPEMTILNPLRHMIYSFSIFSALLTFTDGRFIGATLDRNGLRPSRFYVTKSNQMYMSSEVGVADIHPSEVLQKGRLKPGRMLLVDTQKKVFMRDDVLKSNMAQLRPVGQWLEEVEGKNYFILKS